jgi:hypothetical protein
MDNFSKEKVQIIYNESNLQDFTKLNDTKIFIIVSKLNEQHYLIELQHVRVLFLCIFFSPCSHQLSTN